MPSVCRASYSRQQQPALAPAAGRAPHSLENRTQSGTDSCSLPWCKQQLLSTRGQQQAAKPPFAGFICFYFCLHPHTETSPHQCPGRSTNASLSSPILPAHLFWYSLCFSQPHSHAPISWHWCEAPQSTADIPHFWLYILSLYFVILKTCNCINLALLLCSLCCSWGIPAFPCVPRQPGHISEAADDNTALHCREGRTRTLKSHFRIFHHVKINVISYDIPDYLSNNDLPLNV